MAPLGLAGVLPASYVWGLLASSVGPPLAWGVGLARLVCGPRGSHVGPAGSFVRPAWLVCEVAGLVCGRRQGGVSGPRAGVWTQLGLCVGAAGLARGSCVGPLVLFVGSAGLMSGLREACVRVPFRTCAGSAGVVREPRRDCGPRQGSYVGSGVLVCGPRRARVLVPPGSRVGPAGFCVQPSPRLVFLGACLRPGQCAVAGYNWGWCVVGCGAGGCHACFSGWFGRECSP